MTTIRLLTIKDLCVLAGISRRTVYRIRAAGQLPVPIRVGGRDRWRPEDIERWVGTRQMTSCGSAAAEGQQS